MRTICALLSAMIVLSACSEDSDECDGLIPTFASIQDGIFAASCAFSGCHGKGTTSAGLNLDPSGGDVYLGLVDVDSTETPPVKRVAPGEPAASYLVAKLEGVNISGERMPRGQPRLDECKIDLIKSWISAGAANN